MSTARKAHRRAVEPPNDRTAQHASGPVGVPLEATRPTDGPIS